MSHHNRRSGLTMLEMVISLPTATILIGAMSMCVTIMMRAKSQDETLFRTTYDLSNAASQISSDIASAVTHVSSSNTHIEFIVPDRNGDFLPEQMRYEWGGVAGVNANKILWKYNQQPIGVLFENVVAFVLQTKTVSLPTAVPNHFLSETAVIKSIDAYANGLFREQVINATTGVGEYFVPDIPSSGARWDMGALRLMLRSAGTNIDGTFRIRVMRADTTTRLPIAPILAEVIMQESHLGPTYQWVDVPLAPVSWQSAGTQLSVTITYLSGSGNVAMVQSIESGSGMPTNSNLVTSSNGGVSWTAVGSTKALRLYAFGFYSGYTGQRKFLNSIDLRLGSSLSAQNAIETSVRLLACPEVP